MLLPKHLRPLLPATPKGGSNHVGKTLTKRLRQRKQRIRYRLRNKQFKDQHDPMFSATNIHYEMADRAHGLACGRIGAMHLLAR
jgi:hypothetical protein